MQKSQAYSITDCLYLSYVGEKIGMDGFVLGTTMLFGKGRPYGEVIQEIRSMRMERGREK